jgi:hypothetical protein
MSEQQDGGGLPIVGILAAVLILPVVAWMFLASSAPPAVLTVPVSSMSVPVTSRTPATTLSPAESGSTLEEGEIEEPQVTDPEDSSETEAPSEGATPDESETPASD